MRAGGAGRTLVSALDEDAEHLAGLGVDGSHCLGQRLLLHKVI